MDQASWNFLTLDEFVLDLRQKGGLLEDHKHLVFTDWFNEVALRTLRDDVHQVLAVHRHADPRLQLPDVLLEDARRDAVGRLKHHDALFFHHDVLELNQADYVYREVLHLERIREAIHCHSL